MSTLLPFLKRFGPALAIMAAIFLASSQAKAEIPDFGGYDWSVKKSGHLIIYAVLAWAYLRGLTNGGPVTWRAAVLAACLAALYGASDEFHQSFVAGRGATVVDVLIDAVGAGLGVGLTAGWGRFRGGALGRDLRDL